ncbi:hypothetical protein SH449x_004113 [Pirellulaceae bacterium SH449]
MTLSNLGFAAPGIGASASSQSNQFIWGGTRSELIDMDFYVSSDAADAGSNMPKVLRPGLLMGRVIATGELKEFDVAAVDGTQSLIGPMKEETPLIDGIGRSVKAFAPVVIKAPLKTKNLFYKGVSVIGHADEAAIRRQLRGRFLLDDEIQFPQVSTVQALRTRVTTAQVNAGFELLPAVPGMRYRMIDVALIAIGGNAATATSVDIRGTQSASSVNLLAAAVAGLTQHTLLRAGAANAAILNGGLSFAPNDANTPISIAKTGSNLATATHVDVLLSYELVP